MLEKFREPAVMEYLRESKCGMNRGDPLVCCPTENGANDLPGINVCGKSNLLVNKVVDGTPASLGKVKTVL